LKVNKNCDGRQTGDDNYLMLLVLIKFEYIDSNLLLFYYR